ncbi:MAG: GNAT family N-acetyltransferase [Phycisphaerales bacterium]|nr:MAG: GNAT family N-acetyltransferase [Phycisphaerales bacterium]
MKYKIYEDMNADEASFVQQGLIEFADRFTGPRNYKEFGIVLRDEHGTVCGGIIGSTIWNWLRIDVLWLPEGLRGRGFGKRLLEYAEDLARKRGCDSAMLDTFDFEARDFYEAHGYVVRSQTDDFPPGHTHYRLTKGL